MSENKLVQSLNQFSNTYTLPSTGNEVTYKPITTGQMKNLLTYEGNEDPLIIERILDDVITGCVITEDFNINDINLQDRFDLLIEIRKVSKGSSYEFDYKCSKCSTINRGVINLDELDVCPYPEDIDHHIELFEGFTFNVDFITRGNQSDAISIVNKNKGLNDHQKMIDVAVYSYAMVMKDIVTPDGSMDDISVQDRYEFLNSLSQNQYEKISKWYSKYTYGVVFKKEIECISCDEVSTVDIPITNFFG